MKTLILICLSCLKVTAEASLSAVPQDAEILIGESQSIELKSTEKLARGADLTLNAKHDVIGFNSSVVISPGGDRASFTVTGFNPGHDTVTVTASDPAINVEKAFVRVTVCKSKTLSLTSTVVGWVYFVAWSVSFYPQVYENYRRKSVVGLNFDFLSLNIIGFFLYSVFNCGLYWIPEIESEYFTRHPKGLNPVQLNDIVFSVHATLVTLFTIAQCLKYERGGQAVSKVARGIMAVFALVLVVMVILTWSSVVHWLDFLYACSYIKLTITLIKYIPQAVMNYRRKSTIGWSIGNVALDFTGGVLSTLQMIINADNYNDWASIFGDPTKFGLGLFSVLFDIFFLIQHYILYRNVTGKEYDLSFET